MIGAAGRRCHLEVNGGLEEEEEDEGEEDPLPADSRASLDRRRSPGVVTHSGKEEVEEGGGEARGTEEEREDRKEKLPWQEPIRRQRSGERLETTLTPAEQRGSHELLLLLVLLIY